MAVLQTNHFLLQTGLFFIILPHLNLGLSDFKICGDPECESPISRVQAIKNHHGIDCRFLTFKQGEIIFVYHKLTGKREDLWAGSIDKQFGYFPKDAVREEHIHATTEVVLATQESDFFCMDEFGHLIDSGHLDGVGRDNKVHNQDTESPPTTPDTDDPKAQTLSKFVSAESPASAQSLNTLTEMDDSKYVDATASQPQKEPQNVQGGSASAGWLDSSVTGWFGVTEGEKPGSMAEGEEQEDTQPEASLTSTVTGWLGLAGQGKPEDVKTTTEEVSENTDSFASSMTGWLGFGGKEKTETEIEHDAEKDGGLEQEPAEKYRSRKMSMDIEDNQSHDEVKGASTLEWLGNGLSNRFGLSFSRQESENVEPTLKDPKQITEEEGQPSSWFDMGIGDVLGFNKDKIDVGGSAGSSLEVTKNPTEQSTGSEIVNGGHSQAAMMEEIMAETDGLSEEAETQKDESEPPDIEILLGSTALLTDDSNGDDIYPGTSDSGEDKATAEGLAYTDVHKDTSTQLEAQSQAMGGMPSTFNSFFHTGRDEDVQDNNTQKMTIPVDTEMNNTNNQMANLKEEQNREPGEEHSLVTDQRTTTHDLPATYSSQEHSDVLRPAADEDTRRESEEKTENTDMFVITGASPDHEDTGHIAERPLPEDANPTPQGQGSEGVSDHIVANQPILSSGSVGEHRDQVSNEDDNLINQVTSIDHLDSLLLNDKMPEAEDSANESVKEGEMHQAEDIAELFQSLHSADGSLMDISVDVSEDDTGEPMWATDDNNTAGQKSESDGDAEIILENGADDDILKRTAIQSSLDQTETQAIEEQVKTEDLMSEEEEVKPPDDQEEITTMENEIEGEETQGDRDEIDKGELVQVAQNQIAELTVEVEEVKKEEEQQQEFSTKEEKMEDKGQDSKEDLKKEEETEAEEMTVREGQPSHDFQVEMEGFIQRDTQNEGSSGIATWTRKEDTEILQDEEEGIDHLEMEMKKKDSQENVEDESREEPDCLKDYCPEAPADSLTRDRNGNTLGTDWSSTDLVDAQTGEQHLPTEKDEEEFEMEEDESRKQEEQDKPSIAANDKSAENQAHANDDTKGNSDNNPDLLHLSVMNGDQILSTEVENTGYTEENTLHQEERTKSDLETVDYGTSDDHKTNAAEDSGKAEVVMTKDDDTASPNLGPEVTTDNSVSQHPTSSALSEGKNEGEVEDESRGGFNLLKGAFGYFSQTSATELVPNSDSNADEVHGSLAPDPELDSTNVNAQEAPTVPSIEPNQESRASPPPIQTEPLLYQDPNPLSANPLHQTKGISKQYKGLLTHMGVDEIAILLEHFGRNKMQFMDYICGISEPMTEELDHDESILLDVERLLHYHLEELKSPHTRLTDAPEEEKEKTPMLIALEKLQTLVTRVKEMFNRRKLDIRSTYHQAEGSCGGGACSAHSTSKELTPEREPKNTAQPSARLDTKAPKEEGTGIDKREDEQPKTDITEKLTVDRKSLRGAMGHIHKLVEDANAHARAARELLIWLTVRVVSALPDDIRPGPDLYGMPWEPVIISGVVGLMTVLLFTCRCYSSVKSRVYRSKERRMAEQVAQLLNEKCKVLETLSKCQQEHEDFESSLRDSGVLAQTQKAKDLEDEIANLGHAKNELKSDLEQLKDQLEQQREYRREQERRIAELEEGMKTFDEETKELQLQHEQAQTTLKVYSMNSDRLQRNLETAREENTLLQESNAQLGQQVEGWAERVSELEEEMSRCQVTHSLMEQDVANKDECIMSLTDQLLRMKAWDSDLEEETSNGTTGKEDKVDKQGHLQKVQKLIYAAKLNADLKSVDEDKDRVFAKLTDEVKAKEDLLVSIKEMENEKFSLQSDTEDYSNQVQRLQQKLQIMTEMYQENELKLHRLLTVEEKERLQKEEKLNKADRNIALAMEELNNYRQRAAEMEEELEKTKQSYQTQISAHEKKAHNNWLAARAADRELSDIRRENALLRQKMTDTQFKIDALDKDPFALDNLARPLPFRAERSLYGPSPLGRPGSETRPFLSPPTLVDGPPAARLSPRAPRGPGELSGVQGDMERSGGPHSDSGSNSPTWDRDRRGPPPGPPPPGYLFPEPGGPMFRRPPPPPGPLSYLPPPPGSLPPGPLHPRNLPSGLADGSYRDSSLGREQDYREPGDRRTPPDAEPRVSGLPPPGPGMGPMDGPLPRRGPYGPPPPDFYPPRGPGGPPMMPMWAPPPPGVMFPPRFPPGGPSLPPPPPRQPLTSIRGSTPPSADPPFPPTQPGATGAHTPT